VFWLTQHNEWGQAFQTISQDLQEELFREHRRSLRGFLRQRQRSPGAKGLGRGAVGHPQPAENWFRGFRSRKSLAPAPPTTVSAETAPQSSEQLEDDSVDVILDVLWTTIQRKEALQDSTDSNALRILDAIQHTLLRTADLRSLIAMLARVRKSTRKSEGWQRQHIARLMALGVAENAKQFEAILSAEFGELVQSRSGSECHQQFARLVKQHQDYWREWRMRLQPLQNTVLAQRYPNANLDIQSLRYVNVSEIETLALQQLEWMTDLVGFLTRVWNIHEREDVDG
jgi:hypothetical protein